MIGLAFRGLTAAARIASKPPKQTVQARYIRRQPSPDRSALIAVIVMVILVAGLVAAALALYHVGATDGCQGFCTPNG